MFCCNICEKSFALDSDLENHTKEHYKKITKVNSKSFNCQFCGKNFKLNIAMNKHIQKLHNQKDCPNPIDKYKCKICEKVLNEDNYEEHLKMHDSSEKGMDCIVNLKLCKLNGVWKSKPKFVYKCNICVEKFQNEINLAEHMKIHNRDDISRQNLSSFVQQNISKTSFDCVKCNSKFCEKQSLDLHDPLCTPSSRIMWSKFKNNVPKVSFICTICKVDFASSSLLKSHMTSGCKLYSCTFCNQDFSTKDLWSKHKENCKQLNNCVKPLVNVIKMPVNEAHNQNTVQNNCGLSMHENKSLCTKVTVKKTLDLMDSRSKTNIFSLQSLLLDSTVNKSNSCTNVVKIPLASKSETIQSDHSNMINSKSTTLPHNLILNNFDLVVKPAKTENSSGINTSQPIPQVFNIKKENNVFATVTEKNNFCQANNSNIMDLTKCTVSDSDSTSVINNDVIINIKKEKCLPTSSVERKYLDIINNQEPNNQSKINEVIIKQEPEEEVDFTIMERDTNYYSVKRLPKIQCLPSTSNHKNNEQMLLSGHEIKCKICNHVSIDLHSLALHLSGHRECSMHECVVCEAKFSTVKSWTNHLDSHQQQLDINLSGSSVSFERTEANITQTFNSESLKNVDSIKTETSSAIKRVLKEPCADFASNLNNRVKKLKISRVNHSLIARKKLPCKFKRFVCNYCGRIFSGQGPLTNHLKSHTNPDKNKPLNTEDEKLESTEPLSVSIVKNTEIVIQPIKQQPPMPPQRFVCDHCRKRFSKQCHLTNHVRIVHKINPKLVMSAQLDVNSLTDEIDSTRGSPSNTNCRTPESTEEPKDYPSTVRDSNLNITSSNNYQNKAFCTICQKQFAHPGALISHMHVHSDHRPYKCQYCDRTFNMKGPYTIHVNNHAKKAQVENTEVPDLSKVKVEIIEDNQEEIYNSPELGNDGFNPNGINLMKKNRMWYVCDCCEKKFSTPFQLVIHRRTQHDGISPYVCKVCDKSYVVRHRWNRHIKSHYTRINFVKNTKNLSVTAFPNLVSNNLKTEHQNQFKCGYCKKEYNLLYHWKKHLSLSKECRRHSKRNLPEFTSTQAKDNFVQSTRFECRICKKTYSTDYNRKVHMTNVHKLSDTSSNLVSDINVGIKVQQPMTSVAAQPKTNTNNKKQRHHTTDNTDHQCNLCGKCYSNSANLSRHRNIIHLNENGTTTCNICGRTFKHKYSYREHCRAKHGFLLSSSNKTNYNSNQSQNVVVINKNITVEYLCKICHMKFPDNIALQKHTKALHTINKYKCDDCDQYFETNVILGKHILENHNVKITSNKNHEKNAVVNTSLQQTNNNRVKCKICFKVFSSSNYLISHMRLHSGVKPFKCDLCDMSFRFMQNLRAHRKVHFTNTVA